MKMAIVHDGLLHIGGAEKVFIELALMYPEADLFVPIINKKIFSTLPNTISKRIHTTHFSNFSFFSKHSNLLKPLLIFYWENLDLKEYKLIISSSHSFNSKLINKSNDSIHISYVYTPPRYLSSQFNESQFLNNQLIKILTLPLLSWLNKKDVQSGKKPDLLISISKTIQKRILEKYNRNSLVIYPPCEISPQIINNSTKKYYLCFSRLVKQKGIDLAVRTCTLLHRPLIVVGTGPELERLKKIAGPTVVFKGFLHRKQLETILKNTKALINCAIDEDFGMVNPEIASKGIPIIGFKSGGIKETILENKTGVFFDTHSVESLSKAMIKFESHSYKPEDCHAFSLQFSKKIFRTKIAAVVNYYLEKTL